MLLQAFEASTLVPIEIRKIREAGARPEDVRQVEWAYYIELPEGVYELTPRQQQTILFALGASYNPDQVAEKTFMTAAPVLEIGPMAHFETAWGYTVRELLAACGVTVARIERTRRLSFVPGFNKFGEVGTALVDPMTQHLYQRPPRTFMEHGVPEAVRQVMVLEHGLEALTAINKDLELGMTPADMQLYLDGYRRLGRNATDVELVQLSAGNSDHSRHGTFRSRPLIDGVRMPHSMMDFITMPYLLNPGNSRVGPGDDASAILGGPVQMMMISNPVGPGALIVAEAVLHTTLSVETHNHPGLYSPWDGFMTGNKGEDRDTQSIGRGGMVVAATFGVATGSLHIPGHELPWEIGTPVRYSVGASPLEIYIQGLGGAFYGANCSGVPLIVAYSRHFALDMPDGSHVAYAKCIAMAGGLGSVREESAEAKPLKVGMPIVQIGGPAYRIGVGGVNASSAGGGENSKNRALASVQRGNPEMAHRLERVIEACVHMGDDNPIVEAHDIGGGGATNVYPELVNPHGGRIDLRAIPSGDPTLSVLELWANESQERNAYVIYPDRLGVFQQICARYNVPCAVVGEITDSGRIVVFDSSDGTTPVDLPLDLAIADGEPAPLHWETVPSALVPLALPEDLTVRGALELVLLHPTVASKANFTRSVDRSVTGLVAQQAEVGPHQLPLCGFGAKADSWFGSTGSAASIGEQPIVGLISAAAGGRMAVGEALTNLMGARVTSLADVKANGNWMWAMKQPGEGPRAYETAEAICNMLIALREAVDGGKDSSSMFILDDDLGVVKAPGTYVFNAYAKMDNVASKVTPEFKATGNRLIFIDLAAGKTRLGGSMLAQVHKQIGDDCPDVDDVDLLARCFNAVMELLDRKLIVSLHDKSDGGLVTTLLEMAFTGGFGAKLELSGTEESALAALFNQELGVVLECKSVASVKGVLAKHDVPNSLIGKVGERGGDITLSYNDQLVLDEPMVDLRQLWTATSTALDAYQANPITAQQEAEVTAGLVEEPNWHLTFTPHAMPKRRLAKTSKPRVALLVAQGSNGDKELAATFIAVGFQVDEVTMSDLKEGRTHLSHYRGILFPGGFSYADVLGSAQGWATEILCNPVLAKQFKEFKERDDTFSVGPCNGFQLQALLGWVGLAKTPDAKKPRLRPNISGRFESRLVTVTILDSPAIIFRDMVGSRLGVPVANGDGRVEFPDPNVRKRLLAAKLAPLRYTDYQGEITEQYPHNPNGSPEGIAGMCSPDGRHFGGMPHFERNSNQMWQLQWAPASWSRFKTPPWQKCAQNLYDWCTNN